VRIIGRPVHTTATLTLATIAILCSVYLFGELTLGRVLTRDAIETAEAWSRTLQEQPAAAASAPASAGSSASPHSADTARIDRVVLIDAGGEALSVRGAAAADELREALGAARGGGADLASLRSGTYRADPIRWIGQGPVRSWVVLPPDANETRAAVRVEQTDMAAGLVSSFTRGTLFHGGIASVTFLVFLAGFSYRQRRLATENAAIRFIALHDQLTGLPNRKQFEEFTAAALSASARRGHKVGLFVLDLDGFKAVNDTLGHPVGDGVLRAAAKRLKASVRSGDLLARLSGDEFVVVVPEVHNPGMLAPLADRILQILGSPFRVDGHEISIGCSIGLALGPDNGADTDSLVRNADFALYRAKSEGRRTWRFFDPKMAADLASRRSLEDGLRHALENDQFELLYQPQIELATGRTIAYEAMLRWRIAGKGLVPASVFVSIAEETGLVIPIGEWVIRQVARDCALVPADLPMAINLSAAQLRRDGLEAFLLETLKSHKIAPSRIEIEVNESILGRAEGEVFARLERIRAAGVRIVMDSFGVGTLSLGHLSRGFDKVKVDRSFLMSDEQRSGAVLAAICSIGRSLGFPVVGQGVETFEHAQLLRTAGCTAGQGYYFTTPMPLEQLLRLEQAKDMPLAASA